MEITSLLENLWFVVCGLLLLATLYIWSYWCTEIIARRVLPLTGLTRYVPRGSAIMMLRAGFYGMPGLLLYTVVALFLPQLVIPIHVSLAGVPQGILIGMGYAALGSTLAQGIILFKGMILQLRDNQHEPIPN
ncbi:hypothetical protein [Dictyobacter kobayashii]|uniref:Uncharacterized protein n=1 Tax=Dictyobacter kobayashii TaxID=2014872 RepID=A0A402AQV3_9CHLR|nr:hypothetical protein [Dictyobacter kobayashii]GCE21475.1 hypothetical protein KDK_52750 [Dictyobacter kobayashii]